MTNNDTISISHPQPSLDFERGAGGVSYIWELNKVNILSILLVSSQT